MTNKINFIALFLVFITMHSYADRNQVVEIASTHFITAWQGENGQDHMNILVVSAILEKLALAANDEIAVFSGSICVGASKLAKDLNPLENTTFVTILASKGDGISNGFVENDPIIFKIWDDSNQMEIVVKSVSYRNDVSSWLTTGLFSASATSVVDIVHNTEITQTIQFIKGSNLFSTYLIPTNPDVSVVMKSLCDSGFLLKMEDESGKSYSYSAKTKVWTNTIGSIEKTEGYLISLTSPVSFQIKGKLIDLPLSIPLKTGWNFISIPQTVAVDALKIIQPLIDQKKLIKVVDELGNTIEASRKTGVWVNNIKTFYPGKAYKINVNSTTSITF
ncbi:MAG: hypothetical protein K0M40_03725 [Prolixibacteraceae bacterium]|nr:hypothetical protein [Prolixibacteraceae bacterium]